MSDGPHRSLGKPPRWKKVAEFADNRNFEPAQVRDAVISAFSGDWRADVPDQLSSQVCQILGGEHDSLFRDQKVKDLEALRRTTAGHGLGQVLVDCALYQVINGTSGTDAAVEAAKAALAIWGARHGRNIEEHYCRESTDRRAQHVRTRIEQGIGGIPNDTLARQLLRLDSPQAPRAPSKQSGIDDGVRIS